MTRPAQRPPCGVMVRVIFRDGTEAVGRVNTWQWGEAGAKTIVDVHMVAQ